MEYWNDPCDLETFDGSVVPEKARISFDFDPEEAIV